MTQFLALIISWVIEVPLVVIMLGITRHFFTFRDIFNALIAAFITTLFTHPLAWESNQILIPYMQFYIRVGLIESGVIIIESILYTLILNLAWRQGLFLSMMANLTSFLGGLLIDKLLR
jgi:hypothetical protein